MILTSMPSLRLGVDVVLDLLILGVSSLDGDEKLIVVAQLTTEVMFSATQRETLSYTCRAT